MLRKVRFLSLLTGREQWKGPLGDILESSFITKEGDGSLGDTLCVRALRKACKKVKESFVTKPLMHHSKTEKMIVLPSSTLRN